jgi:tripartite-type tricarboxylate transporter receptor subunit TctC
MTGIRTAVLLAMGVSILSGGDVYAQAFPGGKPITIVVAYGPGSATDVVARLVAHRMTTNLGTTVVVENRPGAGGNIGAVHAKKTAPDGYTVLATAVGFSVNGSLYKNPGYDPVKDFEAVAAGPRTPNLFMAAADLPVKNMADVVALAKVRPLSYGSSGLGTTTHLSMARFLMANGVEAIHVPQQPAQAVTSLLGGHTQLASTALLQGVPHVRSGKIKGLAVTSAARSPQLPDVPTLKELGYPEFDDYTWTGFLVPAGTPTPIVTILNRAINQALQGPEAEKTLTSLGMDWSAGTPADFSAFLRSEVAKWGAVVKQAGITEN